MQVRYQAALRPDCFISKYVLLNGIADAIFLCGWATNCTAMPGRKVRDSILIIPRYLLAHRSFGELAV
jgi:hypothetical protein